ncbi:MAG: class I SAM-dependent methyltransferase [Lysobacterales bacterium]
MSERGYQHDFARTHPAMYEQEGRKRKADTTVAVLCDALGDRLRNARVVNVGCSSGIIDSFIAPHVGHLTGIDIDETAIAHANERHATTRLEFRRGDAMALDFPNASFDVVLCSQVYEHVPNPQTMMDEILRVLAPGGICYFTATNKLYPIEQHYFLPFLSMLPQSLADLYLRVTGKGDRYYERHLTYWQLRRLTAAFEFTDYTRRLVMEAEQFATEYMVGTGGVKTRVLRAWLRVAYWAFPSYVWVLRKPGSPESAPDS